MSDIRRFDFAARIHCGVIYGGALYLTRQAGDAGQVRHVQMWRDDVRDFDEVDVVWDACMPRAHAPARSSAEGRMAEPGMQVELIVTAAV